MRKFTAREDQFIRDNYLTIPAKRISKILGRAESSSRQRMTLLGLTVPKEISEQFKRETQIKPGNIPMNKGKKQSDYMSQEAILRTVNTRFGKGNNPHNTKYDGFERASKDGYVEVRIRKGVFRLKHRVEWEKANGPIPKGHILVCKSRNITDCSPQNWELISMQDNMNRNSGAINLPDTMVATYLSTSSRKFDPGLKAAILKHPDLIKAKRTQLLLNRKIKEHGKK